MGQGGIVALFQLNNRIQRAAVEDGFQYQLVPAFLIEKLRGKAVVVGHRQKNRDHITASAFTCPGDKLLRLPQQGQAAIEGHQLAGVCRIEQGIQFPGKLLGRPDVLYGGKNPQSGELVVVPVCSLEIGVKRGQCLALPGGWRDRLPPGPARGEGEQPEKCGPPG